jgi:NADH:ubiquinone oxidoreductase subunit E
MNYQNKSTQFVEFDSILKEYAGTQGSLITILQKAQNIQGYLSMELINYIAKRTGIKPAKVYGVATFYTQFRMHPVGKYHILFHLKLEFLWPRLHTGSVLDKLWHIARMLNEGEK